jgi:hypothetical protein
VTAHTSPELSKPAANDSLRTLFAAIVARDRSQASRLLEKSPELARQAAVVGATRQEASAYFFETIAHYACAGDTALHMAAAAYATDIAADLVSRGANVRAKNRLGAEPLHYSADGIPGASHWDPAAQGSMVELLIRSGADPNSTDKGGVLPLHRAVRTRSSAAVAALLAHGADARLRNKSGSTPLHLAVQNTGRGGTGSVLAREQQVEIIVLLLRHGARPSDKDAEGRSVREWARADWIRALLDEG